MTARDYYDRYWSEAGFYPTGRMTEGLDRLLSRYAGSPGRVLDVGCGDARAVGPWFRDRGWSYLGIDVSENAVRDAVAAGFEARTVSDASDLPLPDGQLELVVCLEVLEHLFSPYDVLIEIRRVLAPHGILILTVPNIVYWRRRFDVAVLGRWNPLGDDRSIEQPWRDPHLRFFTPSALARLLTAAGFVATEVGGHAGSRNPKLPLAGRAIQAIANGRAYRVLERLRPSVFAYRLHAVATKPEG